MKVQYVDSTNHQEIATELSKIFCPYKSGHFTNGTYSWHAEIVIPTTLAGFKRAMETAPKAPFVIAVNSDKSMLALNQQNFELQAVRAAKVAEPLAQAFPNNQVVIIYYDGATPETLYRTLKTDLLTKTLHKWGGYGTTPEAPKIEGAEYFDLVYAFPYANGQKPVCYDITQKATTPQDIEVVNLWDDLISEEGVLFDLPEELQQYAAKKEKASLAPSP